MASDSHTRGESRGLAAAGAGNTQRYVAWYHELDAWTEYWDVYHPETRGRYYFGDGKTETGLLSRFLPRTSYPPTWTTWTRMALETSSRDAFLEEVRKPDVAAAILEVDALVGRLFTRHFGDAGDPLVRADYLTGVFRFAIDALPPATERDARIPEGDWRKPTAGRHTLDGDIMWFAWALQLEAAHAIDAGRTAQSASVPAAESPHAGWTADDARRALLMAGVACGCPANFAWGGHRRTRAEYRADAETAALLHERGLRWAGDFAAAAVEVHALYRIREWGEP